MDRVDQFRSDAGTDRRAVSRRAELTARADGPAPVDALIVGAGPAGLAAAYELKRAGVSPRILDGANEVASSWRSRHEQLHLNTYRGLSNQPGMRIPASTGMFPSRDDYIAYLERYVSFLDVPIEYGTRVQRIEPNADSNWRIVTPRGDRLSRHVVLATGSDRLSWMPDWPGRDNFGGELIHAGEFRHARHYAGKRVLLVGAGNPPLRATASSNIRRLCRCNQGIEWGREAL